VRDLHHYPAGVAAIKAYRDGTGIVECSHKVPARGVICGFCSAAVEEKRPVKVLVFLPRSDQEVLF